MCGGTLEIHPCSHVGHIFRTTSPHKWPTAQGQMNPVKRNAVRVAEVWLDEYRVFYYERSNYPLVCTFLLFVIGSVQSFLFFVLLCDWMIIVFVCLFISKKILIIRTQWTYILTYIQVIQKC